jgi:hypothetical protein
MMHAAHGPCARVVSKKRLTPSDSAQRSQPETRGCTLQSAITTVASAFSRDEESVTVE